MLLACREDKTARLEELRAELACLDMDILRVAGVASAAGAAGGDPVAEPGPSSGGDMEVPSLPALPPGQAQASASPAHIAAAALPSPLQRGLGQQPGGPAPGGAGSGALGAAAERPLHAAGLRPEEAGPAGGSTGAEQDSLAAGHPAGAGDLASIGGGDANEGRVQSGAAGQPPCSAPVAAAGPNDALSPSDANVAEDLVAR